MIETRRFSARHERVIPCLQDGRMPDCPANGTYRLRSLPRNPICSLWQEGHTLANLNGDDDPLAN